MERMYVVMAQSTCFGITLHEQEIGLVSLHLLTILEIQDAWLYAAQI